MSEQATTPDQRQILIVGGADTGRAPMAAALLRRMLDGRLLSHWEVASAGVVGHDGDPAEPEARDAMAAFHLDIDAHQARSLSDELAAAATVLIAVDSGTARVVRGRYPERAAQIVTLGELAGRPRDIPDPFRMQLGAWVSYVREIETLLRNGLERLERLVAGDAEALAEIPTDVTDSGTPNAAIQRPPDDTPPPLPIHRSAPIERCERLLSLMQEMPTLVEWPNARRQLETELQGAAAISLRPDELSVPYVTMMISLLTASETAPSSAQIEALRTAISRLRSPIDQQAIAELSAALTQWHQR